MLGWALIISGAISIAAMTRDALAQAQVDRTIEQFECRDVMRESGSDREVAVAFLHGYLMGKSGVSKFNLDALRKQTDDFVEKCLNNPTEKAVDVMAGVKK
jgi:hypothetical protein